MRRIRKHTANPKTSAIARGAPKRSAMTVPAAPVRAPKAIVGYQAPRSDAGGAAGQHIPQDAADQGSHERDHQNAEQIEATRGGYQGAFDGEQEGRRLVRDGQESTRTDAYGRDRNVPDGVGPEGLEPSLART